jgi:hypothetical protein
MSFNTVTPPPFFFLVGIVLLEFYIFVCDVCWSIFLSLSFFFWSLSLLEYDLGLIRLVLSNFSYKFINIVFLFKSVKLRYLEL